jgi:hypothetical protein
LIVNAIYAIDLRLDGLSWCRVEWPRFGYLVLVEWTCTGMLGRQVDTGAEGYELNTPAVKYIGYCREPRFVHDSRVERLTDPLIFVSCF